MTKGTLRVLVHRNDVSGDVQTLRWKEAPKWTAFRQALGYQNVAPDKPGLWLLEWEWQEECGGGDEEPRLISCSDTDDWRRPTLADLIALGALPEEGR